MIKQITDTISNNIVYTSPVDGVLMGNTHHTATDQDVLGNPDRLH